VDVAGVVEEEEVGAGQWVARGARGHVGDADVVVRGADVGDELENMCPVCPRHRVNTGQHVPCQMKNHQNQSQVLKVNGFGSWGTGTGRFCS